MKSYDSGKGKDLLDFDFSDLYKIADIITNNDCDITLYGDGVITATNIDLKRFL